MLHFPSSPEDISKAHQRLYFDDMLEFAVQMQEKEMPTGKPVVQINTAVLTGRIISELPYQLTNDQSQVINEIYGKLSEGNKLNALIQGDVACGKTITAFLLMFIAVENGYQSLIMAPTNVLATQHYGDLKEMGEKYGKTVVFLNSTLSTKERKVVLEQIANGEADLIVSTHSAIFQVEYYKLGLVVIDEEHKFGVETREKIRDKTIYDIPFITMSATPIPRTLASTIYGNVTKIFTIASMPSGRKPVNTIAHTGDGIPDILTTELQNGRQAYVVCPLIEVAQEDSLMSACKSVEETLEFYQTYYQACENIHIEALTGKTSKEETERILQDFKDNKIQILISTTVIEVGVNNPNATVIILQNAERYGLTSMHQLRGRVRRGSYEPYCVLCCKDGRDNERINIMCQTDNGFEIAEADLQMRKAGDLVGLKQSGANKTLDLILQYPVMYGEVKKIARQMLLEDDYIEFLQYMKELRCG